MLKSTKKYKNLAELSDIDGNLKYLKNLNLLSEVDFERGQKLKNDIGMSQNYLKEMNKELKKQI